MRVLITGGAGFIGSRVASKFATLAEDVVVLDNFVTGQRSNLPNDFDVRECDVRDQAGVEQVFRQFRPTLVCHLAAQVSTRLSFQCPQEDVSTNVLGTLNVIEAASQFDVRQVITASSMVLYGNAARQPVSEEDPCEPVSVYGITKYAAERSARALLADPNGPALTCLRLFLTYGPGQSLSNPYQGVIAIFLSRVLRGQPIVIFGDGEQTRDVVYIDDVVDAWVRAAQTGMPGTFNVGTGHSHSINKIVDEVLASLGKSRADFPVNYEPSSPGDQRRIEANTKRIRECLGWEARVHLASGIRSTAQWAQAEWVRELQLTGINGPYSPNSATASAV